MKCRYFCRLPLDISPVYLTRGISSNTTRSSRLFNFMERILLIISASSNCFFRIFSSLKCSCHSVILSSVFWISSRTFFNFIFTFLTSYWILPNAMKCSCQYAELIFAYWMGLPQWIIMLSPT